MIELKEVFKSYGQLKVLNNINFAVNKGTFAAIYGPSGSGKTTLLNIIGTIDSPDKGQVIINNISINQSKEDVIRTIRAREIGFAHQSSHMIDFLGVKENVSLPLRLKGNKDNDDLIRQLLEELGLGTKLNNKPSQLSCGEKKRVCLARALINNPKIILADEPTANLDMTNRKKVLELLARKAKEGYIVIVSTHDDDVQNYANQVIQLKNGELIQ